MRHRFLAYAVTGAVAAVVDIGGFHLLSSRLPGVWTAAALSFGLAAAVNYRLSCAWVFGADWRSLPLAARFLAAAGIGLALNAGATWALATLWAVHPTLAKAGGVATAFLLNFALNAGLVFARARPVRPRVRAACADGPRTGGRTRRRAARAAAWRPPPWARE